MGIRHIVVALDFDGTLVTHRWPDIGRDVGSVFELGRIKRSFPSVRYILWTVRSGQPLDEAVKWCCVNDIKLWGVNKNPTQKEWSASPKAHADIFIDDAALGAPLFHPVGERSYINWRVMGPMLYHEIQMYYQNDPRAK